MTPYQPQPLPTESIQLDADLLALTELLAQHAHDVWAKQRMEDGWTWGPKRDDTHKKHPCLIRYEELSEQEKQYDRLAALETLKAIRALGWQVTKPST